MPRVDPRSVADQALYKRLVISHFDLAETRQFLNRLLGSNGERIPELADRIQRDALMTALIVGYARPFSSNKAIDAAAELPERFLKRLTPSQRNLHQRLLELRNQEFAHSDPEPASVEVTVYSSQEGGSFPFPVSNRTRIGLNEVELHELESIFVHLMAEVYDEMRRIEERLTPGDRF